MPASHVACKQRSTSKLMCAYLSIFIRFWCVEISTWCTICVNVHSCTHIGYETSVSRAHRMLITCNATARRLCHIRSARRKRSRAIWTRWKAAWLTGILLSLAWNSHRYDVCSCVCIYIYIHTYIYYTYDARPHLGILLSLAWNSPRYDVCVCVCVYIYIYIYIYTWRKTSCV
jgi:hypothetical protein